MLLYRPYTTSIFEWSSCMCIDVTTCILCKQRITIQINSHDYAGNIHTMSYVTALHVVDKFVYLALVDSTACISCCVVTSMLLTYYCPATCVTAPGHQSPTMLPTHSLSDESLLSPTQPWSHILPSQQSPSKYHSPSLIAHLTCMTPSRHTLCSECKSTWSKPKNHA